MRIMRSDNPRIESLRVLPSTARLIQGDRIETVHQARRMLESGYLQWQSRWNGRELADLRSALDAFFGEDTR